MWIDSHAHLYDLDEKSLTDQINACAEAGVERIINTAVSLASGEKVFRQCQSDPRLFAAVGISPFDTVELPQGWDQCLKDLLSQPRVVALGEIGMDCTNPSYPPLEVQRPIFERQLDIAYSAGLPVVVHSRGCETAAARLCMEHRITSAVFHCFTGDVDALKIILDAGFNVSFSGIITFKNSPLNACVAYAPIDRILIETDSPYLAPTPHRGKRNQPAWVAYVGRHVAIIKSIDEESVAEAIRENFNKLFLGEE